MQENDMRILDAAKENEKTLIEEIRKENGDITIKNCLGQRYLGCGMKKSRLLIEGTPGNGLASYLDGGSVFVKGNAQDAVADTMNEGLVAIEGSAGDALGYAMRGGRVFVLGNAGYRAGVHMKAYEDKTSLMVIGGVAGSFLGEYLAGGTIIVLGLGKSKASPITGYFCGNGMYAGCIYLRTSDLPMGLSKYLVTRKVEEDEKEKKLRPIIASFAETFFLDEKDCLEGDFIAIEADPLKACRQLYAAV